jgi:RNA-directed DNA polymerase
MRTLYEDLRTQDNLFAAWRHVKGSALTSKNGKISGLAAEFEHDHQKHLKRIADQLRNERFEFDAVEGVLKDKKVREKKGKKPRPIVIGTIKNRIVQRAILQILQPRKIKDKKNLNSKYLLSEDKRIGRLNLVNRSRYGVGGLMSPYGGVQPAIKMVMEAIKDGAVYYYQSDIKAFFTKIPTKEIVAKVLQETGDERLTRLFARGLDVNLANKADLLTYAKIFPSGGVGVAQGSSLSAFAGNVLLYDFDHSLNKMNVTAIRYIDDVVILSSSKDGLDKAIKCAKQQLGCEPNSYH